MSVLSRIREAANLLTSGTVSESFISTLHPGADPDEHLWEPLGPGRGLRRMRQLPDLTQRQMLDFAHHFYKSNPIAKRATELTAEYVIGDGIRYEAATPDFQRVLDNHWVDLTNKWPIFQYERVRDLGLTGELMLPAFTHPETGHVTLGNIDTSLIEAVVNHPENNMKQWAVALRKLPKEDHRRLYKIIDLSEVDRNEETFGRLVGLADEKIPGPFKKGDLVEPKQLGTRYKAEWAGSCFFVSVNNPMTSNRGWSDLLADMDWLDVHDQYLFSQAEKAIESGKWVKDATLTGFSDKQVRDWLRAQRPTKPGEYFAHNENVAVEIQSPDLRLEDAAAFAAVLKNHPLAGMGFPPIWFAESSSNRASAPEQIEPAMKRIKIRQRYTAYFMSLIFRYAIDQAVLRGYIRGGGSKQARESMNASFYIKLPDPSLRDSRAIANAIQAVSNALNVAVQGGYLDAETAAQFFRRYMDISGVNAWREEPSVRASDLKSEPKIQDIFALTSESKVQMVPGLFEVQEGNHMYYVYRDDRSMSNPWTLDLGKNGRKMAEELDKEGVIGLA